MTFFCTLSYSQEELTVKKKLKNTIKWNPTPLAFGGNNWVFGYERVLFPSQTASINVGLIQFPELAANSTGIQERRAHEIQWFYSFSSLSFLSH